MLNIFKRFRKEDNEVVVAEVVSVIDKDGNEIVIDNNEEVIAEEVEENEEVAMDNDEEETFEEEVAMDNDDEVEENEEENVFNKIKNNLNEKYLKIKTLVLKLIALIITGLLVIMSKFDKLMRKIINKLTDYMSAM